jgi:hypothetical protein
MKAAFLSKLIEILGDHDVEISYDLAWDVVELFKNNGMDVEQLEECIGIDVGFDQVLEEVVGDVDIEDEDQDEF